ncbi:TVP38/TMEM64 family protein [Candidatus Woesearchaeota archaeon]|jgi:uncharacterized membrane protein YdjX (TVP38/TMEM64 family)|nr:TVP38/TMEM64 family protein [Candidatus Woesearchaeota archaeon]
MVSKATIKSHFDVTLAKIVLLIVSLIILCLFFWEPLSGVFNSRESLILFVQGYGVWAPLILIGTIILQVLIAPIPGQLAGLVSGYLFGAWFGTLYSMIGLTIGSFIAFSLARWLGRPFVEKIIDSETLHKCDQLAHKKGLFTLFLIFLLPALPDDAICFVGGLTKIRISRLVLIAFLGRLPGFFVLNLVGSGVATDNFMVSFGILGISLIVGIIVYFLRAHLEKIITKFLKTIKMRK